MEQQLKIAVRVKGWKVVEGVYLEDDDTCVAVMQADETLIWVPTTMVESVWFMCRWMDPGEFMALQ